jgi:hypothetical protein
MATPTYKGSGQPVANSGWLSGLGSWFGGSAPAYAGAGQPTQASSGLGGATPAYKPASSSCDGVSPSVADDAGATPDQITLVIPRELLTPR